MNPAKLLEDVLSMLQRYAPILVVHVLLVLWVSARVLDPEAMPDGGTIWAVIAAEIDSALVAIGLSLKLWYVLVALVIAYLAAFQWVRSLVTALPFLRLRYTLHYKPELLRYAGQTLRTKPDCRKVSDLLDDLVDRYSKELRETNQHHPYQWQFDRESASLAYYGTLLVALVGALAWAIQGGTMARSTGHVWRLVFLLGFISAIVRWRTIRVIADGRNQLGYWALREFKRRSADDCEDPLRWERGQLIEKEARFLAAARRHPAMIVQSLLYRLPERFVRKLQDRLRPPHWRLGEDWDILASQAMKYQDQEHVPPEALRVDNLVKQFPGLLECPGAGLCLLAPEKLGLAPAVPGGGATFSFAERKHGGGLLAVTLTCNDDLSQYELRVGRYGDGKVFLAEVGHHRIELVAQGHFPNDRRKWGDLLGRGFEEKNWPSDTARGGKVMGGITLSLHLSMHPGSTYLMRSKSRGGTQAVVAFQCFQVEGSAKILVAWHILEVFPPEQEVPEVAAWWHPQAWKEVVAGTNGSQGRLSVTESDEGPATGSRGQSSISD